MRGIATDARIGGEETEISIYFRGYGMVIAGPEMTISPIHSPLAPHDHRDLRVRLPIDEAVDDLHPCAFERRGPKQILLLVEARLQFDNRGHRFARLGRGDQRVDQDRKSTRLNSSH